MAPGVYMRPNWINQLTFPVTNLWGESSLDCINFTTVFALSELLVLVIFIKYRSIVSNGEMSRDLQKRYGL